MLIKHLLHLGYIGLFSFSLLTSTAKSAIPHTPSLDTKIMDTTGFSESDWNNHRLMGPLESTLHMLKKPSYPAWRLHLSLYPLLSEEHEGKLGGYRIVAERINLSPATYKELVENAGKENVDPAFNNHELSDRHELRYYIVQNLPADFSEEESKYKKINASKISCGLLKDCSQLSSEEHRDLGQPKDIKLEKSSWDKKENIPAMLVRSLAKQAGWLSPQGIHGLGWSVHELPEGINKNTPWVEVIIDSGVGSVGAYSAEWHELVTDDSSSREVHHIVYEPYDDSRKAQAYHGVVCSRGENKGKLAQTCM